MIKYFGKIVNGHFVAKNDVIKAYLQEAKRKLEGQSCFICIEKADKPSDNSLLRYLFGVVVRYCSEHFGYTKDEMYEALKWQFLRIHGEQGKPDTIPSWNDLDEEAKHKFIENIRTWMLTEYSVKIPLPNEIEIEDTDLYY